MLRVGPVKKIITYYSMYVCMYLSLSLSLSLCWLYVYCAARASELATAIGDNDYAVV